MGKQIRDSVILLLFFLLNVYAYEAKAEGNNAIGLDNFYQNALAEPCVGAALSYSFGCSEKEGVTCACLKDNFLETVAYCIVQQSKSEQDMITGFNYVMKYCHVGADVSYTVDEIANYAKSATRTAVIPTSSQVTNQTIIIPPQDIKRRIYVTNIQEHNRYISRVFGGILVAWFGLFMLGATIVNIVRHFSPTAILDLDDYTLKVIRRWITLPPTFEKHHSQPFYFGKFSFSIPTRLSSITVGGFITLDFIFLFLEYHTAYPNFAYPTKLQQIAVTLTHRVAILGISLVPLLVLFGGRNNFLLWCTGLNLDNFNVFHRWIGRVVVIHYIIHGVCWTIIRAQQKILDRSWRTAYWRWGFVALMCGICIIVQSLHMFRRQRYDLFLTLHLVLAIGWIMGAWYHLKLTELDRNYMYATIGVWIFDRLMRIVRVLWSGVGSKAEIKYHEGDVVSLKINYSNRWKHFAGCYVFVYILRRNRFWQSHPFTVMRSPRPEDNNKLHIILKVKNGLTKRTKNFLLDSLDPDSTLSIPVLVEGPYGTHHNLHVYDSVILIAGGIGVTSTYSYAYDFIKYCKNEKIRVTFIWYIHDETPLEWFHDELELIQSDSRITTRIFIKRHELQRGGGLDSSLTLSTKTFDYLSKETTSVKDLVRETAAQKDARIAYLCCGPGMMNDDIRSTISKTVTTSSARIDYFEESFSW